MKLKLKKIVSYFNLLQLTKMFFSKFYKICRYLELSERNQHLYICLFHFSVFLYHNILILYIFSLDLCGNGFSVWSSKVSILLQYNAANNLNNQFQCSQSIFIPQTSRIEDILQVFQSTLDISVILALHLSPIKCKPTSKVKTIREE